MTCKARVPSVRLILVAAWALPGAILGASAAPLQAAPQTEAEVLRQLQTMSNDEITRRLLASGLTRNEVREQLRRAGYDPYLADEYFDAMLEGAQLEGTLNMAAFDAFQLIGLIDANDLATTVARPELPDSAGAEAGEGEDDLQVFGSGVFVQQSLRFDPFLSGPVGEDYRLGPGDAITLVLTGEIERVHERLTVARSGDVFIPVVGQVGVQGRTLGEVREILYQRLSQVYSSVRQDAGARTTFSLTVANLRAIQVRVLGSVIRPGAYQLSSVGTLLQALYFAGGPTDEGSYRKLVLSRVGEEPIEIDTYPYLNSGSSSGDPRLQSGDVVFVPQVGKQAMVRGPVRREAIYELREEEGLRELIGYAGGLMPDASAKYALVSRILRPSERSEDIVRVVVNAPLDSVLAGTAAFNILPGDEVRVFPVSNEVRNFVEVRGGVRLPGSYGLIPGMTVAKVLQLAGGMMDDAQVNRIRLLRLNRSTRTHFMVTNRVLPDVELVDGDIVEVYLHTDFSWQDSVEVRGMVRNQGRYALAEGMTAGDLILSAGGFLTDAETRTVEVARRATAEDGTPQTVTTRVQLDSVFGASSGADNGAGLANAGFADAVWESDFPLQAADRVFVRRDPSSRIPGIVFLTGEFTTPGSYALLQHGERLSSLVARSGGITPLANPAGLQMVRQGIFVAVDFETALRSPGSEADPVAQPGDSVHIPVRDNTVTINGGVNFPSRIVHSPGMSVPDLLESAGGPTRNADLALTSVTYPSGNRATAGRVLGLFLRYPEVLPGSSVFVPIKEADDGINWAETLGTTATVLQAVAVNIVAILSLVRNNSSNNNSSDNNSSSN